MKNPQLRELTQKAADTASLLTDDLQAAHSAACNDNPSMIERELLALIGEAVKVQARIKFLAQCVEAETR
jgi:hypothetical protein